jgi:hypothetical protein
MWSGFYSDLQELEQALLLPSFTGFETTTCLFAYYSSSGNAFRRKFLSGHAFTFCSVALELSSAFSWVRVSRCAASQQKHSKKQTPEPYTHPSPAFLFFNL